MSLLAATSHFVPRRNRIGLAWDWLRRNGIIGSRLNNAISVAYFGAALLIVPPILRWALLDATWSGTPETCAANGGACWAFVGEKLRFITFGFYPPQQQWRALVALVLIVALIAVTAWPRLWSRALLPIWLVTLGGVIALMAGAFGPAVPTDQWGGLPLTMLLAVIGFVGGFPLAILLALGRRSRMGGIRLLCVGFIELVRGVPLIAVLYVATLLLPLMLPSGTAIDKLLRAQIAIILFISAYQAEIIRAGLQAVPVGQYEGAKSLGLSYWPSLLLVILPQALRLVIPAFVNLAIGLFQDTTLVIVIGVFDFLNAARVSASDPNWLGFYTEAFSFVAAVYFCCCFLASRYSLWLEKKLRPDGR